MDNKLLEAVKTWLEGLMPSVAESLGEMLTTEELAEMGAESAINGPVTLDLSNMQAPITALNFFVMVKKNTALLAVTADIKDAPDDYNPPLRFNHFFPSISRFAADVADDENMSKMVDDIIEQCKDVL